MSERVSGRTDFASVTPDVQLVLFGEHGFAAGVSAGKVVLDMSSISPFETKTFAQKINALGCDYLDAPVSGGILSAHVC